MRDLDVSMTIEGMLFDQAGKAVGMFGRQTVKYRFEDGREVEQTIERVRWCEDSEIENRKFPWEMPAAPEAFPIDSKMRHNPASPYPVWTGHSEGGVCIHEKGRSEGCILVDTATKDGKAIYNDLVRRVFTEGKILMGEISEVIDRRSKADIEKYPVYYSSNKNYKKEPCDA